MKKTVALPLAAALLAAAPAFAGSPAPAGIDTKAYCAHAAAVSARLRKGDSAFGVLK